MPVSSYVNGFKSSVYVSVEILSHFRFSSSTFIFWSISFLLCPESVRFISFDGYFAIFPPKMLLFVEIPESVQTNTIFEDSGKPKDMQQNE